MTRQAHERPADRTRETALREVVAQRFGVTIRPNRRYHHIDGVVELPDGSFGLIEFRTRRQEWGKFPTLWISQDKVSSAVGHLQTGLPFTFCVCTHDRFGLFVTHDPAEWADLPRAYAGRREARDSDDVELLIEIPIERFVTFPLTPAESLAIWGS